MERHLNRITEVITEYNEIPIPTALALSGLLKELTSELYFLVNHRNHFYTLHSKHILESTQSVAKATVEANIKYPQLYLIRNVMKYADGVVGSLRSNISTLNKEK